MTIVNCPHGCGGTVNTSKDNYCSSCRRDLCAVEIVIGESVESININPNEWPKGVDPMTARKASWCWAWFGPKGHRMRCRLPKNHKPEDEHDTHEEPLENSIIVSTKGELIKP